MIKKDWLTALAIAFFSILFYSFLIVDYTFPSESANLVNVWLGIDSSQGNPYALMKFFALPLGASNYFMLPCLAIGVIAIYFMANAFLRYKAQGYFAAKSQSIANVGAIAASLAFILNPGVRDCMTHLNTGMFDAAWALLAFALLLPYAGSSKKFSWSMPLVAGAMAGLGMLDTIAFVALLPLYFCAFWMASLRKGGRGYSAAAVFLLGFVIAVGVLFSASAFGDIKVYVEAQKASIRLFRATPMWFVIPLFALFPSLLTVFSSTNAFSGKKNLSIYIFHVIMMVVAILSFATSLSPASLLATSGLSPVFFSAFIAFTVGYLFAYWWSLVLPEDEARKAELPVDTVKSTSRTVGFLGGGFFALVLVISTIIGFVFDFNSRSGAFADEIAARVLDDLGERTWLVTDGNIDDNVLRMAHRNGRKLNLVSLRRENDVDYIKRLAAQVKAANLGGDKVSAELCEILLKHQGYRKNRLLPFLEYWFKNDPAVASKVAVWGAPHLWMASGIEPVAEHYFFGGDPSKKKDWTLSWAELEPKLGARPGWGSYSMFKRAAAFKVSQLERIRGYYLRHVGLLATDQGCQYHFEGLRLLNEGKRDEANAMFAKAFDLYDLVLTKIDSDNVSALINEELLASKVSFKKAKDKHKWIQSRMKAIADDANRRYEPSQLFLLYGYICDPSFMLKYGQNLVSRAGQLGHGMYQIRRAIDLIPAEQRNLAELNILASVYADSAEKAKAREIYDAALVRDPNNRTALARLAQLEMLDGNTDKAIEYLQRAMDGAGDDPALYTQVAHLHILKNQLDKAEAKLREVTDTKPENLHAWSLLAVTLMKKADALPESENAKRLLIFKEIDEVIVPTMEKQAKNPNDFFLQSTRAFALMRRGGSENIRKARDSFVAMSRARGGVGSSSDVILSLDMQLDDKAHAEEQAMRTLEVDRNNPMANYIMGSLSLNKEDYAAAEEYLRRSVSGTRAVPLAYNDLAEALRRQKKYDEAESFARKGIAATPKLYVVWETLGSILIDAGKNFEEAEQCVQKACELSKGEGGKIVDVRMLISLARVQIKRGEMLRAKGTMRMVLGRIDELSEFEKKEFEELRKRVK